jgi:peptidyl-prolyl cis-trans isomerase B (cyclophilin B)
MHTRVWTFLLAAALPAGLAAQEPATGATGGAGDGAPGPRAVVTVPQGRFVIQLLPELAPKHVAHFVKVAKQGGFDGTTFHRIIPNGIVQGGDPLSKNPAKATLYGTGGLGLLNSEFSGRDFTRGVVAAVRRPSSVDSAGNQFFICLSGQQSLKGQYTIFGEVVEGMEVVDAVGRTPIEGDRASERVEMRVAIEDPAPEAR